MPHFARAPARLPDNLRVYAVGDVHGCLDRLLAIHDAIAHDLAQRPVLRATLVHLGDYIDRGPDSAGVIEYLVSQPPPAGISESINLLGNHEDLLLSALDSRTDQAMALWLMNGGGASLASWGAAPGQDAGRWAEHLPSEHIAFIRRLPLMSTIGPYLFVHAGVRPGISVAEQKREDLIWIRGPFLNSNADFGVVVVHGHTPLHKPEVRPNRIGIDTGAVAGGPLTCAILEQDRVAFLQR